MVTVPTNIEEYRRLGNLAARMQWLHRVLVQLPKVPSVPKEPSCSE